jgi:hypothetical protein
MSDQKEKEIENKKNLRADCKKSTAGDSLVF